MRICVIGCGYVGLVTGVCFAEMGNQVICIDKIGEKIELLQRGECPLMEPSLSELLRKNQQKGRIHFTTSYQEGIPESEVIFICVQTPENDETPCDLRFVRESASEMAPLLMENAVVVLKSTVPVGTTDEIEKLIAKSSPATFHVANNPEFLREGSAVSDFLFPDRIVIGTRSDYAAQKLCALYSNIEKDNEKILIMDPPSSELVKYASNAMLAMRISFANEIANLCEKVGANYRHVRIGLGSDTRIGSKFLHAGVGWGGSCFPKDLKTLIHLGEKAGVPMLLAKATRDVNERQITRILEKFDAHFNSDTNRRIVGVWGLTYKPDTEDMRHAPSIQIVRGLLARKCIVKVYDPSGYRRARTIFEDSVIYSDNCYSAIDNADALLLITEWSEFSSPDFAKVSRLLRGKVIFDGRNLWQRKLVESYGLTYYGMGT